MNLLEDVKERLNNLGFETGESDDATLVFLISKISQTVKNECNVEEVPEELKYRLIDWVCGEFLQTQFDLGEIDIENVDFTGITSIKEGDTTVSFGSDSSGTTKFHDLVNTLLSGKVEILCFRRLRW